MPIPVPNSLEKKDEEGRKKFISRCMHALRDENKPQDQKLGICFTTYKNAKKKKEAQGSSEPPIWEEEQESGPFILPF
jgi:hypothetical protein